MSGYITFSSGKLIREKHIFFILHGHLEVTQQRFPTAPGLAQGQEHEQKYL